MPPRFDRDHRLNLAAVVTAAFGVLLVLAGRALRVVDDNLADLSDD